MAAGSPHDEPRKLLILTGLPGSGKSSLSRELIKVLGDDWEVLHADDFVGPTYSLYRDPTTGNVRPWPLIRSHHARFAGESVAYHMNDHRKHVLLEGHFRTAWELATILAATSELLPRLRPDPRFTSQVVLMERDRQWIVDHMVTNPHRFPDLYPPTRENSDRVRTIHDWVYAEATIDLGGTPVIQVAADGVGYPRLAREVLDRLESAGFIQSGGLYRASGEAG